MDNIPWMFRIAKMRVSFEIAKRKAEIFYFSAFLIFYINKRVVMYRNFENYL